MAWLALAIGLALTAAFVHTVRWETWLGREPGSLTWGPTLFRALLAIHAIFALLTAAWCIRTAPDSEDGQPARWFEDADESSAGRKNVALLAMGSLLLLGLALRLVNLDSCLWLDEVLTMVRFARPPLGIIVTSFPDQNQHMLYSVLAHLSFSLFGESAWSFRLPAVLFGVGSIPVIYALARSVGTRLEAWLAAGLLTVAYHHVWFSQNARGYTPMLFFSMLSTWLWLRGLDGNRQTVPRWLWPTYVVSVVLGLWTHMTMLFVVFGHGLVWLAACGELAWRSRNARLAIPRRALWAVVVQPLLALLIAGTLTLQVYALSLPEFLRSAMDAHNKESIWQSPWWVIQETLRHARLALGGPRGTAALIALPIAGAIFLSGLVGLRGRGLRLVAVCLISIFSALFVMMWLEHNLWPRFFFFAMGFLIIIVIRGAMVLGELVTARSSSLVRDRWAPLLGAVPVVAMMILSLFSLPRIYRLPKQDYAGAKEYVETHRDTADGVASSGRAALTFQLYFAPDWPTADTAAALAELQSKHDRVWLIYTLPLDMEKAYPEVWQSIQQDFTLVKAFKGSVNDGEVYVCRWSRERKS
jgi:uncharacterized membrane protein